MANSPLVSRFHPRMFIAQATLEAWVESGQAYLQGASVALGGEDQTYTLEDAVRFRAIISDDPVGATSEVQSLIGRVLDRQKLAEFGGECLDDTVLFGDTAFTVELGYIGTRVVPKTPEPVREES